MMKKKLAILLALVMVLAFVFVGCGESKDDTTKKTTLPASTEEAIIGSWAATIDFTDLLVESMGDMDGMEDYFDFKDFNLKIIVEFEDDDTFTISLDEETAEESIDRIVDQMMDGLNDYFVDEAGMTLDDFLAAMEISRDEYVAELKAEMDVDSFDMAASGTYTVDGDTIVATEDDSEDATTFEYANGTLKIVDFSDVDADMDEFATLIKSATFKKN